MIPSCPLCGGDWPDHKLRENGGIVANDRGHIVLVGVQLTLFRAAKRPGGVTMQQAEKLTGAARESIRVAVCLMNQNYRLGRLGEKLVNVNGVGVSARYVLREVR